MAIRFTAEGGFYEVPDPPPPPKVRYFPYRVTNGPSRSELFDAVRMYPARKTLFAIIPSYGQKYPANLQFTDSLEVLVSGIRVLLMPMEQGAPTTIDTIKHHWLGEGFVETSNGFVSISFCYDVKKRKGTITFITIESG